jgi:hypothetical protein
MGQENQFRPWPYYIYLILVVVVAFVDLLFTSAGANAPSTFPVKKDKILGKRSLQHNANKNENNQSAAVLEVTEKRKRLGRDSSFRCRCRPD